MTELETFRAETRAWLEANLPAAVSDNHLTLPTNLRVVFT